MQGMGMMVTMLAMFAIFYFLLIRPQVKRQKEHQALLAKLGKGDEVIIRGGLIGKITGMTDDNKILVLEIQEKVRVRVPREYVDGKWGGASSSSSQAA